MGWVFRNAHEVFDQYREMWDEINRAQWNHILLDSLFVGPLIRFFASQDTLFGISNDRKNPGMVLVDQNKWGFWQTFQPSQEPLGLILLGNRDDPGGQVFGLFQSLPRYALGFSVTQQDPDCTAFRNVDQYRRVEVVEYIKTVRLTVRGTFEEYWKKRGRNLLHNLSRQRRRLAEQRVSLELVANRDPGRVAECIREYGRLEETGWKASQGTAVTADNTQGMFYREILENFCRQGEGVIYQLLMNGKVVASDLCLQRNQMMVILKTAYDESIEGISLGLLLHQEVFRTVFSEGRVKVVEFYGRVRDWHTKWTDEIRTMYHLNFYRYGWIRVARRLVKTSRTY